MKYMVDCNADISAYHSIIVEAMNNGGVFTDEFADIFVLVKTPNGSAVDFILKFA